MYKRYEKKHFLYEKKHFLKIEKNGRENFGRILPFLTQQRLLFFPKNLI